MTNTINFSKTALELIDLPKWIAILPSLDTIVENNHFFNNDAITRISKKAFAATCKIISPHIAHMRTTDLFLGMVE
ncbi:hypothetical protein CHH49_01485 [Terribacillus saccharophilus]|uniref:hypothetical protein n=1 Tax=Terribacillus saccharophilus TaxID=361277 RepID=UPI000BA58DCF|nr:hypothetical protein [Terribacillus saccharophilus]PAF23255.1 hypothetical protein CHH49_01485 [Terribacillus saccharophilus]